MHSNCKMNNISGNNYFDNSYRRGGNRGRVRGRYINQSRTVRISRTASHEPRHQKRQLQSKRVEKYKNHMNVYFLTNYKFTKVR